MRDRNVDLKELDKSQLVELVELLLARIATLEQHVAQLQKDDKKKVKKTSQNSSTPPSQDQKAKRVAPPPAKRGPKAGHVGRSRQRMEPDEIIECRLLTCPHCGEDLGERSHWIVGYHQVIDVPPLRPVVREARRYRVTCPQCRCEQTADYVEGFETGRVFGAHLEQLVLYLHYAHPLSYQRVQGILSDLYGLKISEGALVNAVKRAQNALREGAHAIHQQLKQARVIGSDETGARVQGQRHWQWVFQTPELAYHVIQPSRSAQVLTTVMGEAQPAVWVSDVLSSQMCHPAREYQICLAHQVRDLQYLIDLYDCQWAHQVQTVFLDAMRLHRQRDALDEDAFMTQRQIYEAHLETLLDFAPNQVESETLRGRFLKHRQALLLFLHQEHVPPTNNASEQALRNSVIYRKVTGGFRTDWGAQLYADVISILETARRQERDVFSTLADILHQQPVFHTPHSS